MTRTGTGGRTRNHRAPGGPAGPVREWPGDQQTRATSAAGSAGSAGTRPPGQGHGGREAHRWSCGPAAGPARAGIRRRPPRGARPSGWPRWPRPPRASRRAARSSSPVPGVRPGPGGLPRAAGPPRAPGTPRGPGPARSVRCFPAPRSARRVPGSTACHRAGSSSGGTPPPREARSSSASTDRSLLGRSGLLLRSRLVMLPSKRRGGRMRYTAAIHACRGRDGSRRGSAGHAGLRQGRGQPP